MSKIVVDTIESTGATVTVNDALTTGTNAITAGSVTGLTATSLTSGTLNLSTVTLSGAIPAAVTFAGAGVAAKIYSKDQSTSSYSLNSSTWYTTGLGFYHAFSSTKTYIVSCIMQRLYCDCNASEWSSQTNISICRVTSSTTVPASGSTTTPGSEIIAAVFGQSGPNTSTLNHDTWHAGSDLRFGPFTGTGSTDVIYANLKTYNTNVTSTIAGVRWIVEEYDVAPTIMS